MNRPITPQNLASSSMQTAEAANYSTTRKRTSIFIELTKNPNAREIMDALNFIFKQKYEKKLLKNKCEYTNLETVKFKI